MMIRVSLFNFSFCVRLFLSLGTILFTGILQGQSIDLLLKGGHVYDAKNQVDGKYDVAISEGKIYQVAPNISTADAKKVLDVSGLWICPGLIDIHTHVFAGSKVGKFADGINSIRPDDVTLRSGITTVVDAGTSGWRNFEQFKTQVIDESKTRVLAFLNVSGLGMTGDSLQESLEEMNVGENLAMIRKYPDDIVGVKIGHYTGESWIPFDRAIETAEKSARPVFVECHLPQYTLEEQLDKMRSGDIITHSFEKIEERESVVDDEGLVKPFVFAAQSRGVNFDVGHGGAGFWFSEAIPALKQGLAPSSFGSDLHKFSLNAGMKDMLNIMSKYMAMGMEVRDVIVRATWNSAKALNREDLGNLGVGSVADLAVLRIREGVFGFVDAGKNRIEGNKRFEAELTIRAGKIVYDLNGISAVPFKTE